MARLEEAEAVWEEKRRRSTQTFTCAGASNVVRLALRGRDAKSLRWRQNPGNMSEEARRIMDFKRRAFRRVGIDVLEKKSAEVWDEEEVDKVG